MPTHLRSKTYAERKLLAGYEEGTPTCASCCYRSVIKPAMRELNWCSKGLFKINLNACCDRWRGRDGSQLGI